jgi:hypothetical protein
MRNAAKVLHFPFAGLSRSLSVRDNTQPSETRTYATPLALNVRGTCVFADRQRGGSRPGLKRLSGVVSDSSGVWRWPNGGAVEWPDGGNVLFDLPTTRFSGPDGAPFVNPHQPYAPRASKGSVPAECRAMAFYRYRLFVASGAQWYASRSGDLTDWDYGGDMEDLARAATGNVAHAGVEGETITAMMPVLDSLLYVATARSLWCLAGEPTNGVLKCVSTNVGCVGPSAWCFDGTRLWLFSAKGVYSLVPGEGGPVLSSKEVPQLKATDADALMVPDFAADGVHLFSADGDWFIEEGALWPVAVPAAMRPVAAAHVIADGENRTVLLGSDGKWRYFDDSRDDDDSHDEIDGAEIASCVAIGPFRTSGRDDEDGILDTLHVVLAEGSDDVSLEIYPARTAEAALAKAEAEPPAPSFAEPAFTATVGPGFNHTIRPRVRGAWCVIVLRGTGRWAYETATATCKILGRLR